MGSGLGGDSGRSLGSGDCFGSDSWPLDGVGRLALESPVERGFGLSAGFGLVPGKWPTLWITVPALSLQIAGFGLPVAAVAVTATPAMAIATSAGAKRHAPLTRLAAPSL